jgi:hypothetical protein
MSADIDWFGFQATVVFSNELLHDISGKTNCSDIGFVP